MLPPGPLLILLVTLPLLGALLVPPLARVGRGAAAWGAAAALGGVLGLLLLEAPAVLAGAAPSLRLPWIPALQLEFALRLDALALLMGLMVAGIGLLVVFYAHYYLPEEDRLGRFFGLLLLFAGAMLGIVLADHLLLLLIFWELTSLSSFLLVGYHSDQEPARRGARMALVVTGGGGLALLAGFLLLGEMAGSYRIPEVLAAAADVHAHPWYAPALILILLGAFTKSAQFPFHFWLPQAMAAPTPVSAYLHSATMVKAGVFLLARLHPAFANTELWFYLVGGTGLVTLLFGAWTALFRHDLKGLLAWSTISHLGLITLLFGLGTPLGAVAGIFHLMNHATFKAALFMAAGIIDHETGTRDLRRINGLWNYMPHTALLAMISAAAMAGVPLLNGFLSKEMFFAETVHHTWLGPLAWLLPTAATLAGVFTVAYSARFIHDTFFHGEPRRLPRRPHEPRRYMRVPVELLTLACVLVGLLPQTTIGPLLHAAAGAALNAPPPEYSLALWHGPTLPLAMSLTALGGGVALYAVRLKLFDLHAEVVSRVRAERLFERGLEGLRQLAERLIAALDNGALARYLGLLVGSALLLGGWPLVEAALAGGFALRGALPLTPVDGMSLAAALLLAAGAAACVRPPGGRVAVLVATSVVGLVVTLTFIHFSAPDLALTQILVELTTTVLLLLALYYLPGEPGAPPRRRRLLRDITLAGAAGLGAGLLAFALLTRPQASVSGYHLAHALPIGGGANVVNVILVDFRGFDTLGEITVLAVAAAGIYALLKGLRLPLPAADPAGRPWAPDPHPWMLMAISRPLLPLALLVALFLLLRGHHAPGGGFIAGLTAGTALILQHLASGIGWSQARLPFRYFPVVAAGLGLAVITGLVALGFGRPFLTSGVLHLRLPLIGELELASAMAFDIGVFLTVVGTLLIALEELGALSRRQVPHPPETPGEGP